MDKYSVMNGSLYLNEKHFAYVAGIADDKNIADELNARVERIDELEAENARLQNEAGSHKKNWETYVCMYRAEGLKIDSIIELVQSVTPSRTIESLENVILNLLADDVELLAEK